jgi:hypothetical protein
MSVFVRKGAAAQPPVRVPDKAPDKAPVRVPVKPLSSAERVRARAYEIFLSRRGAPGDPVSDWLQAEREITKPDRERLESHLQARGEAVLSDAID